MTPLRQRMIDAMVLRGFAARTQETYLSAVGQAAKHHHCSPALLTDEQVQAYLLYLLQERQRSRSTVNITSCALRFLVCGNRPTKAVIDGDDSQMSTSGRSKPKPTRQV